MTERLLRKMTAAAELENKNAAGIYVCQACNGPAFADINTNGTSLLQFDGRIVYENPSSVKKIPEVF